MSFVIGLNLLVQLLLKVLCKFTHFTNLFYELETEKRHYWVLIMKSAEWKVNGTYIIQKAICSCARKINGAFHVFIMALDLREYRLQNGL